VKQGSASRDRREGRHVDPSANGINPGYVAQLGNKVGSHVTNEGDSSYRGEKMHSGRGFEAPRNKSQSHTRGSQGRY